MPQSAPLTPVELRLLTSFNQVGLETLRKGLLSSISLATGVELRARAVTLTAHQNDFRAVFTDVLRLPAAVLREGVTKPRSVFDIRADVALLREALQQAQAELRSLGLSQGYLDLIDTRLSSNSPQQVVNAASAVLLFGAMLA